MRAGKRIMLCFITGLMICMFAGGGRVYAATGTYSDTKYTLTYDQISSNSTECRIKTCSPSWNADVVIPEKIDGLTVTSLADFSFQDTYIKSVTMPDTVKDIGMWSFRRCSSLETVSLSKNLTEVPYGAFEGCGQLETINIPEHVERIFTEAFSGCRSLKSIELPDSVKEIGVRAFYNCNGLSDVKFGNGLETVKEGAFYKCNQLKAVVIPDSVTTIGTQAFGYIETNGAPATVSGFTIYEKNCSAAVTYAENNNLKHAKEGTAGTPTGEITDEGQGNNQGVEDTDEGQGNSQDVEDEKTTVISKNTVLRQNGSVPYAGIYCYDGNLTLDSGVQLTSSGISQLAIIVKGKLTIKRGAAIRVRNGYYQEAPTTKISNIRTDNMILYGNEDSKNGIMLFPNTYGKGGDGGDGGNGGNGYKMGSSIKAPGNGGHGGGGGYGGGKGGAAGSPGNPYSGGASGTYGNSGLSNGGGGGNNSYNGGGATGLGEQGTDNASSTTSPGGGGGGNGGDGGSTSSGGTYIMANGGSGGGGGYGGGVLTIYADSIEIESTTSPVFVAHGQCGGVRGKGGNSGENGSNGEGGMLIIQTNDYQYNTAHWTTSRTSKGSVGESYTEYGGGHSSLIHTKPQAVFVNGVKISTGSEIVPDKWDVKKLSDCSIADIADQAYTGASITPAVTIRDADGKILELNVDYTVSYAYNIDQGTALVTIKGKGEYAGTSTKTFEIVCEHTPGAVVTDTAPTCTVAGRGHISCTICGAVLDSSKVIKATGHKEVMDPAVEPTCTDAGYTEGSHCSVCNVVLKEPEEIEAYGHTGGAANCKQGKICTRCGQIYTQKDSSRHGSTEIRNAVEATDDAEGYTGDTYCIECGEKLAIGRVIPKKNQKISIAGLNYGNVGVYVYNGSGIEPDIVVHNGDVILKENEDYTVEYQNNVKAGSANIIVTGKGDYTGKKTLTFTIQKAPMAPGMPAAIWNVSNTIEKVNAIILSNGWQWKEDEADAGLVVNVPVNVTAVYVAEDRDNYEKTEQTVKITRTACVHSPGGLIVDEEPTCTVAGRGHIECILCKNIIEEDKVIEAYGHNGGIATCIKGKQCLRCNEEYTGKDTKRHEHTQLVNVKNADCINDGYTGDTYCEDCLSKIETGTVIAASHAFSSEWSVDVEATETTPGSKSHHCTNAGCSEKSDVTLIPALGKEDDKEKPGGGTTDTGKTPEAGDIFVVNGTTYKITSVKGTEKTASYVRGDKQAKKASIPSVVSINGTSYKVTAIADNAFAGNSKLTSVTIPSSVTKVGKNAFKNCTKLKKITIPKNVTEIGSSAFTGCKKMTSVKFNGTKVSKIGNGAFRKCSSLKSITIPKNVTEIGKDAFRDCKKLNKVTIKGTKIKKIGKNAFKNIGKNPVIKVPKKKKPAYKTLLKKAGYKKTVK